MANFTIKPSNAVTGSTKISDADNLITNTINDLKNWANSTDGTSEGGQDWSSGGLEVNASLVGLENCNNTSDLDKPISTATQTALDGKTNINTSITLSGDVSGSATLSNSGATITTTVADDSHNHTISNIDGLQSALDGKLGATSKAYDSNLLDGINSTSFIRSDSTTTATSKLTFNISSSGTFETNTGGLSNGIEILSSDNNDAMMTFHVAGRTAVHFGLDSSTSDLTVGGWSFGGVAYKILHEGNFQNIISAPTIIFSGSSNSVDISSSGHGKYIICNGTSQGLLYWDGTDVSCISGLSVDSGGVIYRPTISSSGVASIDRCLLSDGSKLNNVAITKVYKIA
jgi:hypothetical protein